MAQDRVEAIARELLAAEDGRQGRAAFTSGEHPDLDEATGYEIQDRTLQLRLARGERLVGVKLGLTSRAKQQRMKVDSPLVGWITDAHRLLANEPIPQGRFIQPRAEAEIFFTLKKDLQGPGITPDQVRDAVDTVYAGLDIIDSRFSGYSFGLADVVADNCSAAGFVVGPVGRAVGEIDLELEAVLVEVDGGIVATATGAAILGHPLAAVAEGANILARRGLGMKEGQLVLAGALTDAIPLEPGRCIAFHFTSLGSLFLPPQEA